MVYGVTGQLVGSMLKREDCLKKYSILYDGGQTMTSVEETIEPANEDDEDEQPDEGDIDEMNRSLDTDSDTVSCDSEGRSKEQDKDDEDTDEDCILAKYNQEMGSVDRHNFYRQGILKLHSTWKTKRWQTRIQLEILALTLVDTFLACRKLIPKWQDESDEESVFWKFVCHLLPQIDPRPRHERTREEETDPTSHCIQIRLGVKRTASGKNKGAYRAIQGRCTSCRIRRKKNNSKWVTPPTA